eukprot:5851564-Amphidinium_carterae.1
MAFAFVTLLNRPLSPPAAELWPASFSLIRLSRPSLLPQHRHSCAAMLALQHQHRIQPAITQDQNAIQLRT